jgi:pimeloyl-ACP methyl ester carboxylesterase
MPDMARRFVLVHSPVVGPGSWVPVAEWLSARGHSVIVPNLLDVAARDLPSWPVVADIVSDAVARAAGPAVIVLHSHAGLYASHIVAASPRPVEALIFADASIPPEDGEMELVPADFLSELRSKADDGLLPRWTDWWPQDDVAALFPDDETRRRFVEEQPRLSLPYYEQVLPIESGWSDVPCGYLAFGPGYADSTAEARIRGWRVVVMPGEHLHMLVDPAGVGEAIEGLADALS